MCFIESAWWGWGRDREEYPRHDVTKVSLDTLKMILSTSYFQHAPLALAHVFFLPLLLDLLHKRYTHLTPVSTHGDTITLASC